jgi:hypothetical protein
VNGLRRLAVVLALAILGSLPTADALASFTIPIPPKIDHAAKTITFEGRLYLYADRSCKYFYCQVTDQIVNDVRTDIENTWNNGYKFKCYAIVVKATVERGPWYQVPQDAVGVRIDRTSENFESVTSTDGGAPTHEGSTWGSPPRNAHTYAHEFGHVLGLDDTYTVDDARVAHDRDGTEHDLMNTGMSDLDTRVDQSTIDELVRRAGIRDSDLRCNGGWEVRIVWTDTYDGVKDTVTFDGVVDTIPLGDEFVGISLIGKGTASGSRAGWVGCNPGFGETSPATVPATFLAIIANGTITVSAYADIGTALSGVSTGYFTADSTAEDPPAVTIPPNAVVGDPCPHNSYGTATLKPLKPTPS